MTNKKFIAVSMPSFVLTRYLYVRDEVEVSLFTALLQKTNIEEAYFWAYELHYSGFDLFAVLWRIYYDVYFELNPYLEVYLSKKQDLWSTCNDVDAIAYCVKNLFLATPSSNVFILRQMVCHTSGGGDLLSKARAYPGRPPKWCAKHPKKYQVWLRAIDKKDYTNIAYHTYLLVRECHGETESLFAQLLTYFEDIFHVKPGADAYWKARKYYDDAHYLLSIIVHLLGDISNISMSRVTKAPRDTHLNMFREFGDDRVEGSTTMCIHYKILGQRRLYGINPNIGAFTLARYRDVEVTALDELFEVNSIWERFVFETPYWASRFKRYGATFCVDNKRVCFPDDDACEEFYDTYGYEPDEQSRTIRDRSLGSIPETGWKPWYNIVFKSPCLVDFDETFQFIL